MAVLFRKSSFHFFLITVLLIHYLFPLIFINQVIINPHDNLEILVVYDHIISKIYNGDFSSTNYFLSGQIKWFFLEKFFYPLNILHLFLNDKEFYFTIDILKKIIAYFSFFILAKKIGIPKTESGFASILYSALVTLKFPSGFGLPLLPYILYLLVKNKSTYKIKDYLILIFFGLNSSLVQDFFAVLLLIPLSQILNDQINIKTYKKIYLTIIISIFLSHAHLIIGTIISEPIHRIEFTPIFHFSNIISNFFGDLLLLSPNANLFVLFNLPVALLLIFLYSQSLISKNIFLRKILLFIFSIFIIKSLYNYFAPLLNQINYFKFISSINFERIDRIFPLLFVLLFANIINNKTKRLKVFINYFCLTSVILLQLKLPVTEISSNWIKQNYRSDKLIELKNNLSEKKPILLIKNLLNKNNFSKNDKIFKYNGIKTFNNYYKFEDYKFLKLYIKDERVMSVGLDPMIAIMNNIKTIDGYHTLYPLDYKHKFRKIIKDELEDNKNLKNYYDNWGNRVYAFYNDEKNLKINFDHAKKLGAKYIISGFKIQNETLKKICSNCNKSSNIYLYEIL